MYNHAVASTGKLKLYVYMTIKNYSFLAVIFIYFVKKMKNKKFFPDV